MGKHQTRRGILALAGALIAGAVVSVSPAHATDPEPAYVGNRVWLDENDNGIQDSGEGGVAGVALELLDAQSANRVFNGLSAEGGWFGFRGLDASRCYRLQATPPDGHRFVSADQGASDTKDSDIDPETGIATSQACFGDHLTQWWWDIGLVLDDTIDPPDPGPEFGYLGNRVWLDLDADGRQGSSEPGVAEATVSLVDDATGRALRSGSTNSAGWFGFSNLDRSRCYRLRVAAPGLVPGPALVGEPTRDSDLLTGGETGRICLDEEARQAHRDLGLVAAGPAGGCVIDGNEVQTAATQPECDALRALWSQTSSWLWSLDETWGSPTDPCNWTGVGCDADGVVSLEIMKVDLTGEIPSELGDLTRLQVLNLANNETLTGTLPAELFGLTDLRVLNVRGNNLTGSIPPELSRLSNLEVLDIEFNRWTGTIPAALASLDQLRVLRIGSHGLTGPIPPEIGDFASLVELKINSSLPVSTLPPEIGNLQTLEILNLRGARIGGTIPAEIGNLSSLVILDLYGNLFEGGLPPEIGQLGGLEELWTGNNRLLRDPLPATLGDLASLRLLAVGGSYSLGGRIPPELGQLTNLEVLNIATTAMVGPIPAELGNLENLRSLTLANGGFSGQIPAELGRLTSLDRLTLTNNRFLSGPIPAELQNLDNLTRLSLDRNRLSGDVGAAISGLTDTLERVRLSDGPGRNDCLTSQVEAVRTFLDEKDPGWEDCDAR